MFKPDRVMTGQLGLPRDFKKHSGARTFVINILFFCLLLCLCMYFSFFPRGLVGCFLMLPRIGK